ncbi:unnamed protein product [Arabidopsis lyrata]|nr:unnamed protein product [Arabidopsis lyrata]
MLSSRLRLILEDAGHEHMQEILGLLFNYIQLLQQTGVCQWIFDVLSAICETKFHYQDKIPPMSYIVDIASNMQIYPTKDWLVGSSLPAKFNPAIAQKVVDELSPSNVRIFWEAQKFEGHTDKAEPWYNTAYSLEKMTSSTIQEWVQSAPDVHLHLPAPNIFIPTDLSLKDANDEETVPVLLRKTPFSRLWYKPDTMFSKPKAYVKMDFKFSIAHLQSALLTRQFLVLTDIFTRLLMDYLNEYACYAQVAGLYDGLSLADNGFELTLLGYNHKLRILLETVVGKIAHFEVKPDRFAVIKETVTKEYQNYKFRQPYHQAMYYCSLILQDQTWPWTEELDVLPHLEAEDVVKFVPMLLSRTFIECYIAGNVENNEAESMVKHIEDVIFNDPKPICRPLFPSQHLTNRVVKLGEGLKYFYHQDGSNPSDENSALVHYIQSNVTALIDMKLKKHKNLKEESRFYWREIQSGTLKFNRKEAEVAALKQLQKQELIDFFDEYIKVGAARKKSLSIRVYGSKHLKEMTSDKDEVPSPSVETEDIVGFRKSKPLHGSFRGCGQPKM